MVDVAELLGTARLTPRGLMPNASNHTLLVQVGAAALGVTGVYKPQSGERPLWDFPSGSLCRREVAAYAVSEFLGWDVVPLTVLRDDGPLGPGSLQAYVPHDPGLHYFALVEDPDCHPALARMAVFDLLINNADRKASHVMLAEDGRIRGCDHGLSFHPEPKLRTVIWELGGRPIEPGQHEDLRRLARALEDEGGELPATLRGLLSRGEVRVLARRAALLADLAVLPDVEPDRRPYPWPLL